MKLALPILVTLMFCACAPGLGPSYAGENPAGMGFLPRKAEKGSLFVYYNPKTPSKWQNNWTSEMDLTGVSWNDSRTATLISPSFVVMAAHYARPPSVPVMFHDKRGNPHERFIVGVKSLREIGDIIVARLHLPLPPEVKPYRFAKAGEATLGKPVIVTDQTKTLSVHRIEAIMGGVIRFGYHPELNPIYQRNLISGDSGNPSFLLENGELVLLETHTTGGAGAGPFFGDPAVQDAVRKAMLDLTP